MKLQNIPLLLSFFCLSAPAWAESPPAKILYVGAIAIEPCQDAKVLADWYARLGLDTKKMGGMYFAKIETAAGTMSFAIHAKKADAPKKSSASVAIVLRVENLEASLAAAKVQGLEPEATESDPFGKFAHFSDPDGNKVTLWGK